MKAEREKLDLHYVASPAQAGPTFMGAKFEGSFVLGCVSCQLFTLEDLQIVGSLQWQLSRCTARRYLMPLLAKCVWWPSTEHDYFLINAREIDAKQSLRRAITQIVVMLVANSSQN